MFYQYPRCCASATLASVATVLRDDADTKRLHMKKSAMILVTAGMVLMESTAAAAAPAASSVTAKKGAIFDID